MLLFLILLAACIVGGFLITSLMWILFWVVGIFEVPQGLKVLLRKFSSTTHPLPAQAFYLKWEGQSATKWAVGLSRIERSSLSSNWGSASRPVLGTVILPDRKNTAPFHGLTAH